MRRSPKVQPLVFGCIAALVLLPGLLAAGQDSGRNEETVKFHFAESIRLTDLIDYVSERTQTRFIYDDAVTGDVILRSPLEVKVSSLLPLLRSILDFKGFQMVETDGWYTIRRGTRAQIAKGEAPGEVLVVEEQAEELRPDGVYTVLLHPRHIEAGDLSSALTAATGLTPILVPKTGDLILTDYGSSVASFLRMASLLDRPRPALETAVYTFEHVQVSQVKDLALGILRAQVAPDLTVGGAQAEGPALYVDQAASRMILLLPPGKVEEALAVLKALDAAGPAELRPYEVKGVEPDLAATFIKQVVRARAPGLGELTVQPVGEGRLLIIAAPTAHEMVREALELLGEGAELALRYYVVQHVEARRIETLAKPLLGLAEGAARPGELLMAVPQENMLIARLSPDKHSRLEGILERFDTKREAVRGTRTQFFQIRNTDAKELAERLRSALGVAGPEEGGEIAEEASRVLEGSRYVGVKTVQEDLTGGSRDEGGAGTSATLTSGGTGPETGGAAAEQAGRVRIVADENTNSIIVQAPVEYQETIAELVAYLDRRRPQVLIEATVAFVSVSSDLMVAVELMAKSGTALIFTSFGLSTVDVETGTRTLIPGTGLNAGIVDPEGSGVILRALHLVNDNATARFESILEEPFVSLNIGETVSTTTFAGYAEAGLTIEVTPRISEGNFVRLDCTITSRDFTGTSMAAGVPPRRKSDEITSSVTLPDGHTAIMGGLVRRRTSEAVDMVPILGRIPILGALFRSSTQADSGSRLFVFLRPVILRDEDFSDLKELSREALSAGALQPVGPDAIYPPV